MKASLYLSMAGRRVGGEAAVIVKAGPQLRGGRTHGLLAYLLGPGRHTDHVDPRVITGWIPVNWLPGTDV